MAGPRAAAAPTPASEQQPESLRPPIVAAVMKVEIWSDVVCPWCWIGKRHLEQALAGSPALADVEIVWRSFELDPSAPASRQGDYVTRLAAKYGTDVPAAQQMLDTMTARGAQVGLDFRFDRAQAGNTFDAHRLLHHAATLGRQDALKERLFRATFTQGQQISAVEVLVRAAEEVGLDGPAARAVLASDAYAADVRAEEAEAAALGATGVPFFVVDRRYGVSGAQLPAVLREVLERAHAERAPLRLVAAGDAPGCEGDTCAV